MESHNESPWVKMCNEAVVSSEMAAVDADLALTENDDKRTINPDQHISQRFDDELARIRNQFLSMGGVVESQLQDTITAMIHLDEMLAGKVIAADAKVNDYDMAIHRNFTDIMVHRQPAAADLRLVVAVIKATADLERIGDEAVKIARMAIHLAEQGETSHHIAQLNKFAALVLEMLHESLDAFARLDAGMALAVAKRDRRIDSEYDNILRQVVLYMMDDPRTIRRELNLVWIIRALERIGDHCHNLCEYLIFYRKGKDIRHKRLDTVEDDLKSGVGEIVSWVD